MLGKIIVTTIIVLWTALTYFFVCYSFYQYITYPDGSWIYCEHRNSSTEFIEKRSPESFSTQQNEVLIFICMVCGTIMLIIGPFQLSNIFYKTNIHVFSGGLYVISAAVASSGGISFMTLNGTNAGSGMTVPFTIYSTLVVIYAIITVRYAINKKIYEHLRWAFRMYIMGSTPAFYWLLSMISGIWTQKYLHWNT